MSPVLTTEQTLGGHLHDNASEGRFWPVAAALALAWLATLALILQSTVPTDVGWYLVSTRKWLAGAELYRGIAAVIVGGMSVSTLFTLILLPSLLQLTAGSRDADVTAAQVQSTS